jgi:type II secretory pathway component PulK
MSGKKRVLLLVAIMAVACMVSTITTIVVLYRTALEEQRDVLISIAMEHVRLIEELAGTNTDQNMKVGGGEAESALLKKIASAHSHFDGIGHTGEFKLAKRVGNNIVFLLDHRYKEV